MDEPILIIAGNEDTLIPIEVAKSMTMIYPKGELAIINDTGHYSAMENPESYSKSIKDFLAKR
jgi:pimeloyl-ACP methyl ester carboxylesterase